MKIASSELQFTASHSSAQSREVEESLKMWSGPQRPDFENRGRGNVGGERVVLSDAGKAAAAADSAAPVDETLDEDPKTLLIRLMLEMMTGKSVRTISASELSGKSAPAAPQAPPTAAANNGRPATAGFGIEYDYRASYSESESTSFAANGVVKTADGQEIRFNLQLQMSRSYQEETSVSLRLGDAAKPVDPLVLNFAGNAADLLDQRFSFDLDADGSKEQIAQLASGSAYLSFARNQDGRINDGSELFGPASGDGFAELAALDDDGNGWIDENDAAFSQLSLWQPGAGGDGNLQSLSEAGVGAIALAQVATPFELNDSSNQSLGRIRNSGIFLQENGGAGTIQQIDLSV